MVPPTVIVARSTDWTDMRNGGGLSFVTDHFTMIDLLQACCLLLSKTQSLPPASLVRQSITKLWRFRWPSGCISKYEDITHYMSQAFGSTGSYEFKIITFIERSLSDSIGTLSNALKLRKYQYFSRPECSKWDGVCLSVLFPRTLSSSRQPLHSSAHSVILWMRPITRWFGHSF